MNRRDWRAAKARKRFERLVMAFTDPDRIVAQCVHMRDELIDE
jgi:hypothetical protein